MEFDFDSGGDRLQWSSTKWEKYRGRDVIPLWIADMDFATAPAIQQAVMAQAADGNFGYMAAPRDLGSDLATYYLKHYAWAIDPEWIVWLPGLVLGLNLAVRACCAEGESALTFTPVYPPFLHAARLQGRASIEVPLRATTDPDAPLRLRYDIDFEALAAALRPDTRLLLLCHPHNPVGRVFDTESLRRLAEICIAHDLFVCSDEVHCDLILDGDLRHLPFAAAMEAVRAGAAARSITLHSPGKVFNLAGLGVAWALIPDPALRRRFRSAMARLVPDPSCFGFTALQAALREGEPWRQALLAHLRCNRDALSATLDELGLPHTHPEATFLTWIDARGLNQGREPAAWFEARGLGFNEGADFGAPGFVRFNFAVPRPLLDEALARLRRAVAG
jgi:cystathionine beta-lyase